MDGSEVADGYRKVAVVAKPIQHEVEEQHMRSR
jgi:hypothetical protein